MALVNKNFSDIVTFSRASTATYFNASGVLSSAASGAPRLDFDPVTLAARGLLIEEQRTNLLLQSGWPSAAGGAPGTAPTGWALQSVGVPTTALATSIYGNADGANVVTFSGVSGDRAYYVQNINVTSGQQYQLSADLEAVSGSIGNMFTIIAGTATGTINTTVNNPATIGRKTFVFTADTTGSLSIRIGIGTTGTLGAAASATIGRPQLEAGSFATSYIPTTTAQATRAADVATINALSPWFNAANGALYVEFTPQSTTSREIFWLDDGTSSNRIALRYSAGSLLQYTVDNGGANQASIAPAGLATAGNTYKASIAYAANDFVQVTNGTVQGTDSAGTVPSVTTAHLGISASGGTPLCGWIRKIQYYPSRLTNAQLQSLTA